jgi:hypothetical protein
MALSACDCSEISGVVAGVDAVPAGQPAGHGGREHRGLLGGGGAPIPPGGAGLHAGDAEQPPHDAPGGCHAVAACRAPRAGDAPAELRRALRPQYGTDTSSRDPVVLLYAEVTVASGGRKLYLVHVRRGCSAVGSVLVAVSALAWCGVVFGFVSPNCEVEPE